MDFYFILSENFQLFLWILSYYTARPAHANMTFSIQLQINTSGSDNALQNVYIYTLCIKM